MASPVPYRANSNQQLYTPSFPPPIYYRDTFGLQPLEEHTHSQQQIEQDDGNNEEDDDGAMESDGGSGTTKSTVRNQIHIFHPNASVAAPTVRRIFQPGRRNTGFSGATSNHATLHDDSQHQRQYAGWGDHSSTIQSMQVEELLTTDQVLLIVHARHCLWLSTIFLGVALQLVIFAVVSLFFDGHWFGLCFAWFLLINSILLLTFVRHKHTRFMLYLCTSTTILSILFSIVLFALTAYFIKTEDSRMLRGFDEQESNRILQNARMTMYSLQLLYAPISVLCNCAILYILLRNWCANRKGSIHKGFFLSRAAGHQKMLIPIKIRQTGSVNQQQNEEWGAAEEERAGMVAPRRSNTSTGMQTSSGFVY